MGIPLISLDVPVVKTSSAILCMTKDEVAACEETACINCGRCVSVCPGRIIPARLADYAKRHDKEAFEKQMEWSAVNVDAAAIAVRQNDR